MGGRGDLSPALAELFEYGDRESRALYGVGAGAQLVYHTEGRTVGQLHNPDDVGDVGREGGQALLDALFVADVDENAAENAELGIIRGGYHQAAHGHQGEQAEGLEAHGLAAGVGAGYHEGVEAVAEADVYGDDAVLVYQRVAGFFELDHAIVVHLGARGLHAVAQMRFGKNKVKLDEGLVAVDDLRGAGGAQGGKLKEYAFDLFLFFAL